MKITPEYLQQRPLSYSSLKEFAKSPKHYLHYVTRPKKEPSLPMILGSMVDCLLWTEDKFESMFMILPEINRRTTVGKAQYKEILKNSATKKLISAKDLELAKRIKKEICSNPSAVKILNQITQPQKEERWIDKETGLPLIKIMDGYGDKIISELKTTRNAEPQAFAKDAFNLDYTLQAGLYSENENGKPFFYLAIETEEPFGISVLRASDEYIEYGRKKLRRLLNEFQFCLNNNLFEKGYDYRYEETVGYDILDLPAWAKTRITKI